MKKLIFGKKYLAVTTPEVVTVIDADAQLFVNSAVITSQAQGDAIDNLVIGLKSNILWTKFNAIYPFVGGNATAHKFNLKDPRDLDVAYRLSFGGAVTHTPNGVKSDGSSGYANTFLNPNTTLSSNSLNISFYSKTDGVDIKTEIGCYNGGNSIISFLLSNGSVHNFRAYDFTTHEITRSASNSLGLFTGVVLNGSSQSLYKNGSILGATNTIAQTQVAPNFPIYILARNDSGTAVNFSNRQCAFATIGEGLTSSEVSMFYTLVQDYQTALNRQV